MRFVDLFAGLGGFHRALARLGHECVFACEIDAELRELYLRNFPECHGRVHGDIREVKDKVPPHDLLCAGFPCQPFSKSGDQRGLGDETHGTLFHEVLDVLKKQLPKYVLLENVGNFERHDNGRTWQIVHDSLEKLGYNVRGTEHVKSGGSGLVSPHHLGFPHTRERFFIAASLAPIRKDPFPRRETTQRTSLQHIVQSTKELSEADLRETSLSAQQLQCINHWNNLIQRLPDEIDLPSFPIWGDEIFATYPFRDRTPYACSMEELSTHVPRRLPKTHTKTELLARLPSYARTPIMSFPRWKIDFIAQNRDWFDEIMPHLPMSWIAELQRFPPSLRKLEWNCQGEERDLWRHVLQFRPSGLRVKRYSSCPALVAMTTTQIPILGRKRRFLSRTEGLRLQGFPDDHHSPKSRERAFRALGNAVHVGVVEDIAKRILV